MASYFPKESRTDIVDIDLDECITQQNSLVSEILKSVIDLLEQDWQNHKNQFMTDKLIDLIPPNHGYMISKLYEGVWCNYPLVGMTLKSLGEHFTEIKEGITKRYGTLKASSLQHETDQINYMFEKLTQWDQNHQLFGNKDAEIFIYSLDHQLLEIYSLIKEMDEHFS